MLHMHMWCIATKQVAAAVCPVCFSDLGWGGLQSLLLHPCPLEPVEVSVNCVATRGVSVGNINTLNR